MLAIGQGILVADVPYSEEPPTNSEVARKVLRRNGWFSSMGRPLFLIAWGVGCFSMVIGCPSTSPDANDDLLASGSIEQQRVAADIEFRRELASVGERSTLFHPQPQAIVAAFGCRFEARIAGQAH